MSLSIRVNKRESDLIRKYAELNGSTVSEVMRNAILEKIEDQFDIFVYNEAIEKHNSNPKTFSLQEAKEILDID